MKRLIGFDSRSYQMGLDLGALSLVSTIEELLGRKSSVAGVDNRDYGRRGYVTLTMWHPLSRIGRNLAYKRRSSSLADSCHGHLFMNK
jgi:hypothetical protein